MTEMTVWRPKKRPLRCRLGYHDWYRVRATPYPRLKLPTDYTACATSAGEWLGLGRSDRLCCARCRTVLSPEQLRTDHSSLHQVPLALHQFPLHALIGLLYRVFVWPVTKALEYRERRANRRKELKKERALSKKQRVESYVQAVGAGKDPASVDTRGALSEAQNASGELSEVSSGPGALSPVGAAPVAAASASTEGVALGYTCRAKLLDGDGRPLEEDLMNQAIAEDLATKAATLNGLIRDALRARGKI